MRLSQLFFKTVSSRKGWVETPLYWKDKEFRNSPVCVIARVHNKKEIQIWNSIVIQAYLYLECTICNRVPNKGILMAACFPCSLLLSLSLIYNADLPLHTRTSHTPSFMSIMSDAESSLWLHPSYRWAPPGDDSKAVYYMKQNKMKA